MTDLMAEVGNTVEQTGAVTDDMKGNVNRSMQEHLKTLYAQGH
jgi:hypothetical protein